jgi:hypothetical protein
MSEVNGGDPSDRPGWVDQVDNPYLHGIHAPTVHETTAFDLPAEGEIPSDLCGAYVRNGPNQVMPPTNLYHWFDGDGMVHAVTFRDGRASYRSRFVSTAGLADEMASAHAIWPGVMGPFDFDLPRHYLKDTANHGEHRHHLPRRRPARPLVSLRRALSARPPHPRDPGHRRLRRQAGHVRLGASEGGPANRRARLLHPR